MLCPSSLDRQERPGIPDQSCEFPTKTGNKSKSPSMLKRDQLRMCHYNLRKMKEIIFDLEMKKGALENESKKKTNKIFKLEVEISSLKFKSFKTKPKLSIRKVVNQEIPPVQNVSLLNPPKPKLSISLTSNTCDTLDCQYRRRPCYALNPANQIYLN